MTGHHPTTALRGLGETITRHRVSHGLTQQQLAGAVGVSRQTIARVETGHSVASETLTEIAAVLGLHVTLE